MGVSGRAPIERLQAWLVTGPPGHAWSAMADITVFWFRWASQRMLAGAGRLFSRRR